MSKWIIEPGHTAAGFRARHMMVTWVRGHFKDVHGTLEFDADNPSELSIEATFDVAKIWTGEAARDEHLRSADFFDVDNHPMMTFKSSSSQCVGAADYKVTGDLTIRGISQKIDIDLHYLGMWQTPFWTDKGDQGPISRIGFVGASRLNRQDFKVSWNGEMENNGVIVGDEVLISVDIEALLEADLERVQVKVD